MKTNKSFSNRYVKYMIKNNMTFYLFVLVGVILFVSLSLSIKLDVLQTVSAEVVGQEIIIDGEYAPASDTVYLYTDRNEDIKKVTVNDIKSGEESTILYTKDDIDMSGSMNADISIGKQSLLELVFRKAGN